MAARKTVTVVVREGAVVYHDGRAFYAGDRLELPASEAKTLREQGVVEE